MMRTEIKISFAHQVIADAAHDQGVIPIAQFRDEHSHGKGALFAERARQETGLIIEFASRITDAFTSLGGNRTARNIVKHYGNRGGAEAEIVREDFQADWFIRGRLVFLRGSHSRLSALASRIVYFALQGLHKHSLNNGLRPSKAPRPGDTSKQPMPRFARSCSFPGKTRQDKRLSKPYPKILSLTTISLLRPNVRQQWVPGKALLSSALPASSRFGQIGPKQLKQYPSPGGCCWCHSTGQEATVCALYLFSRGLLQ